jgi:hypothetical protein
MNPYSAEAGRLGLYGCMVLIAFISFYGGFIAGYANGHDVRGAILEQIDAINDQIDALNAHKRIELPPEGEDLNWAG